MLALRFANGIFEPIWNRQFIDHVQITVAESIGIEGRAGYYEQRGRDPRHLPEPPAAAARADGDGAADRLHRRVRAQREGEGAEGAAHARPEVGRPRPVRPRLRRGRRGARVPRGEGRRTGLDDRHVRRREALRRQLALGRHAVLRAHGQAARAPGDDDRDPVQARAASAVRGGAAEGLRPNVLLVHVQPDEGVSLAIGAKVPGSGDEIRTVHMDFLYGGAFRTGHAGGVRAADPRHAARRRRRCSRARTRSRSSGCSSTRSSPPGSATGPSFPNYAAGTWGPPSADDLLHRDGRSWRRH